ncbi:hypothetical protein SVIOM342S_08193 [Streptomyces violaceorubidus]
MVGMRRGTRRGRYATLLTAAVAVSLAAAGCTAGPDARQDGRAPEPERSHSAAPAPGPVLAVKVDNVRGARPQTGLEAADVVYAEPVEAGLSRLMAIYATELPASVGPVRSARESDLELLGQFDRPVLAFSGAQSKLLPLIDKAPLRASPGRGLRRLRPRRGPAGPAQPLRASRQAAPEAPREQRPSPPGSPTARRPRAAGRSPRTRCAIPRQAHLHLVGEPRPVAGLHGRRPRPVPPGGRRTAGPGHGRRAAREGARVRLP